MTALTPDEARGQECPMMTYCANESAVIQDGRAAINYQARCAGPDCKMGWRWLSPERDRFMVTWGDNPEAEWAMNPSKVKVYAGAKVRVVKAERRGYCGFAGHPEVAS